MTLQEIQYKAQSIISKWRDDDSAPYIEFVEELAHMIVPEPSKDLEEAAEEKYPIYWKNYPKDGIVRSETSYDTNKQCREAFIAGAKWQKLKDEERK